MGGAGSGTWHRGNTRTTLDDVTQLDIRWLQRQGYVPHGARDGLAWSEEAPTTRAGGITMVDGRLVLNYPYWVWGGVAWKPVQQEIAMAWMSCHYGCQRPWFVCPQCARRLAVLYLQGTRFACRHCVKLPYGSHYETAEDRRYRKVRKIRKRFGASGNLLESLWPWDKPKGMHWRIWERLRVQEAAVHAAITAGLAVGLARLVRRDKML